MLVNISHLKDLILLSLKKIGHNSIDASIITETLLYAELRNNNQGIIKLITGGLNPNSLASEIEIIHETLVSAKVNGAQRTGMVVVSKAVDIAVEKALNTGIGLVGCSNYSSATGALGHWANIITKSNLIGIVMSQCPEMVAPFGSYQPIFGTNPIAIGIPTLPRPQILDMATSAAAWYSLEIAKSTNSLIPDNIAYDCNGNNTNDPIEAMKGALKVFDNSYKGSHLSLMVELLAGSWTGAAMNDKKNSNNWGSLIIAINPNILGPVEEFQANASIMCERVKNAYKLPQYENSEIYLPGERGDRIASINESNGTLEISNKLYEDLVLFSKS